MLRLVLLLLFATTVLASASLTIPTVGTDSTTNTPNVTTTKPATTTGNGTATTTGTATVTQTTNLPNLGDYPPCVSTCLELAISNVSCTNVAIPACYCTSNKTLPTHLISCISDTCPDQLSVAEDLTEKFCAIVSTSLSFSITTLPTTTATNTTNTSPTQTGPTTTGGSQPGAGNKITLGLVVPVLAVLCGAMVLV